MWDEGGIFVIKVKERVVRTVGLVSTTKVVEVARTFTGIARFRIGL